MRLSPASARPVWAAAALCAVLAGCSSVAGDPEPRTELYEAQLSGAQEVPAVASAGTGRAELRLDRKNHLVRWTVSHSGLSGPLTAAHIHGPAGPGQNAPALIPLNHVPATLTGQLLLTPEQASQLESGQWYVNLHTARHPQGEIRGQLRHRPD
jgi:CHRD domain